MGSVVYPLNRGSDIYADLVFKNPVSGAAIDYTGAIIALYEPHEALSASVSWVNPAIGHARIVAEWAEAWPLGKHMTFRVRILHEGRDITTPAVVIDIA